MCQPYCCSWCSRTGLKLPSCMVVSRRSMRVGDRAWYCKCRWSNTSFKSPEQPYIIQKNTVNAKGSPPVAMKFPRTFNIMHLVSKQTSSKSMGIRGPHGCKIAKPICPKDLWHHMVIGLGGDPRARFSNKQMQYAEDSRG